MRKINGIIALSLAAVVFSGCSNTSSSNTTTPETTTAAETTTEAATEAAAEVQETGEKLVLKKEANLNEGIAALPLGMFLTATDYKDGILTCTLSNQTGEDMRYGKEYYLQKFEDGKWVDMEAKEAYGWDKMALMLKDLEETELRFDLTVFGDLTAGKYQLVRDDSTAEFELVSESDADNASAQSMGMANPMRSTDAEGIMNELGFTFAVPADAENVEYFIINDKVGEVDFDLVGAKICGRTSAESEFTDISGMYYTWDVEDTHPINNCEAQTKRHIEEGQTVDVCMWYDAAPGLMYSVTAEGPDLDGFDIIAVAEQLFPAVQGNVG